MEYSTVKLVAPGALPQHTPRGVGENVTLVGLDVHKAAFAVCHEAGRDGEVTCVGEILNEPASPELAGRMALARLRRAGGLAPGRAPEPEHGSK